jgi:hypothetical protein
MTGYPDVIGLGKSGRLSDPSLQFDFQSGSMSASGC